MLARLVGRLECDGIENTVVSLAQGGALAAAIAERGIRVIGLGMKSGRPSVPALLRLVRLLKAIDPHVLQTWLYHADLMGLVAGALARVPATAWNVRCSTLNYADYSRTLGLVVRVLARTSGLPDAVVCNSVAGRREHEAIGYRPRRWVLIPNGVDTDAFKPCPVARADLRAELRIDSRSSLVGLLARYHPMKDHPNFLRAAALVARQHPSAHFLVVGRGVAGSEQLRKLVVELGIGACIHLQDERHDAARVLAALDIAVSSSNSGEGFPNMVIEAMASGVPCVVTDVGDCATIVENTGVTVPPGDPQALAEGVRRLLDMPEADRAALGQAARARVLDQFSLQLATDRYHALYTQLAGGQPQGRSV
jgi:glycosyltransferase involved in cell wall biosynthesis